jgi:hypothetical protein
MSKSGLHLTAQRSEIRTTIVNEGTAGPELAVRPMAGSRRVSLALKLAYSRLEETRRHWLPLVPSLGVIWSF